MNKSQLSKGLKTKLSYVIIVSKERKLILLLMITLSKADDKSSQHKLAYSLLRECLRPLGIGYTDDTPLLIGKHGKPALEEHPDVHFNVSHSSGIAACIVSERKCGIDCEKVGSYRQRVAERVCTEAEKAMLAEVTGDELDTLFFRLWTLKEAFIKAIGIGLAYPMNTVGFSFSGDEIICTEAGYSFRQYVLRGGEYVVSVCEKD